MRKRIFIMILAACATISMTACGNGKKGNSLTANDYNEAIIEESEISLDANDTLTLTKTDNSYKFVFNGDEVESVALYKDLSLGSSVEKTMELIGLKKNQAICEITKGQKTEEIIYQSADELQDEEIDRIELTFGVEVGKKSKILDESELFEMIENTEDDGNSQKKVVLYNLVFERNKSKIELKMIDIICL